MTTIVRPISKSLVPGERQLFKDLDPSIWDADVDDAVESETSSQITAS